MAHRNRTLPIFIQRRRPITITIWNANTLRSSSYDFCYYFICTLHCVDSVCVCVLCWLCERCQAAMPVLLSVHCISIGAHEAKIVKTVCSDFSVHSPFCQRYRHYSRVQSINCAAPFFHSTIVRTFCKLSHNVVLWPMDVAIDFFIYDFLDCFVFLNIFMYHVCHINGWQWRRFSFE